MPLVVEVTPLSSLPATDHESNPRRAPPPARAPVSHIFITTRNKRSADLAAMYQGPICCAVVESTLVTSDAVVGAGAGGGGGNVVSASSGTSDDRSKGTSNDTSNGTSNEGAAKGAGGGGAAFNCAEKKRVRAMARRRMMECGRRNWVTRMCRVW